MMTFAVDIAAGRNLEETGDAFMSEKSERKPNTDQLKVINELDSNLILFASAGTGKTFSVAQRVKHIIEKKQGTVLCNDRKAKNDL